MRAYHLHSERVGEEEVNGLKHMEKVGVDGVFVHCEHDGVGQDHDYHYAVEPCMRDEQVAHFNDLVPTPMLVREHRRFAAAYGANQ